MFFKIINPESLTIEQGYQAEEVQPWGGPWGQMPHVAVPENMDAECVRAISYEETVTVVDEPEHTIPAVTHMEEVTIIDQPETTDPETGDVIPAVTHQEMREVIDSPEQTIPAVTHEEQVLRYGLELDPALVAAKALRAKGDLVKAAAKRMWDDILAEMERVYSTPDMNSATAYYLTWGDMVSSPESYVGELFPSANAVTNYATDKLQSARTYAIFRIARIRQYEQEKAAILAAE
jgi:hypothetical protein